MRILIIIWCLISVITFGNNKKGITIIDSEKLELKKSVFIKAIKHSIDLPDMAINVAYEKESFTFMNDCIAVFSKLNDATHKLYATLKSNTNSEILKTDIDSYNKVLHLVSFDVIYKYTQSENKKIRKSATDLTFLITDLMKLNYAYLDFITFSKHTADELKKRNELLHKQNKLSVNALEEISLEICLILIKENPNHKVKQYSVLTLNQRNLLNIELMNKFGVSINKREENDIKNSFESSSILIYTFLNMELLFEKE